MCNSAGDEISRWGGCWTKPPLRVSTSQTMVLVETQAEAVAGWLGRGSPRRLPQAQAGSITTGTSPSDTLCCEEEGQTLQQGQ